MTHREEFIPRPPTITKRSKFIEWLKKKGVVAPEFTFVDDAAAGNYLAGMAPEHRDSFERFWAREQAYWRDREQNAQDSLWDYMGRGANGRAKVKRPKTGINAKNVPRVPPPDPF